MRKEWVLGAPNDQTSNHLLEKCLINVDDRKGLIFIDLSMNVSGASRHALSAQSLRAQIMAEPLLIQWASARSDGKLTLVTKLVE